MMSVASVRPGTRASRKSATRRNSATVYSRRMRSSTSSLPLCTPPRSRGSVRSMLAWAVQRGGVPPTCTGTWRKENTCGCRSACATASRWSRMKGGLVMPTRSIMCCRRNAVSAQRAEAHHAHGRTLGMTFRTERRRAGRSVPMSRPYAPVSSLLSHTSRTPSLVTCRTHMHTRAHVHTGTRTPRERERGAEPTHGGHAPAARAPRWRAGRSCPAPRARAWSCNRCKSPGSRCSAG